jgi:outer membrane protein TolC
MTQLDYQYYNSVTPQTIPPPNTNAEELVPGGDPRTVADPENRKDWRLSLQDAKRIALQNNKRIAFLGYDPGIVGTQIDAALARFDAWYEFGGQWGYSNTPLSNSIQVFGTNADAVTLKSFGTSAGGFGVNTTDGTATLDFANTIPGQNLISISKRNATGGLGRLYYSIDYQNSDPISPLFTTINPAWRSIAGVNIEQPLLQGAGVEFNRAPVLIARANHEQSIKSFELEVQQLLRDVEYSYWDLYFTYRALYSREVALEQALVAWQKEKNKEIVGAAGAADVAQAREQFELYRSQRLDALNQVLTAERRLRDLLGLPPDDEYRILPADSPTHAKYEPNWEVAVGEAMELRPDLAAQRFRIRAAELEVRRQRNGLLPDLTVSAGWLLQGLDDQWDQSVDRLTDGKFEAWTLGVRLRRQIGERSAYAAVRQAQLQLSQARAQLRSLEHGALHELTEAYQNLVSSYQRMTAEQNHRDAAADFLQTQQQVYDAGRSTTDILLRAQSSFADALRDESQALVNYNKALIQWEYARGRILDADNVVVAEQRISLVKDKLRMDRMKWMQQSVPIRLHPGARVPSETGCPPDDQPLYPPTSWGHAGGGDAAEGESEIPEEAEIRPDRASEPMTDPILHP